MNEDVYALVGLLITNAGVMFGMWKYFDSRLNRIYQRFDEYKNVTNETYVRKDHCTLLHSTASEYSKNAEARIEIRFDKLEKKIQEAFDMIIDLLKNQPGGE